ncbi:MAG: AAA family ATPase [Candidatus Omnitrophota bacterium]
MYSQMYGLKTSPFNVTSDPDFFFESASHREAISTLIYGIQNRKGIILITGEVGTGKTTLCKALLERLAPSIKTSLLLNPYFSEVQLLQAIVEDFGIKAEKKNRLEIIKQLNAFLVDISNQETTAVLIIDEAQNLSSRQLEQIRLLSNLETPRNKLLQIVLSGQPELLEKLNKVNLRQIRQRIFVKHNLKPLAFEEVQGYVDFRLKAAGGGNLMIAPNSYDLIYEFSKGVPRLINMLCDRALLLGFVTESKDFGPEMFSECIKEIA